MYLILVQKTLDFTVKPSATELFLGSISCSSWRRTVQYSNLLDSSVQSLTYVCSRTTTTVVSSQSNLWSFGMVNLSMFQSSRKTCNSTGLSSSSMSSTTD
ncbi:hypothetical protein BAE44_0001384 [Dichanthelium oligosanthes]|uniref:Uncharacterized protein n=1 Tax=Dichanthelium oligosanthes TaxID=888268 RepID=A0A1E5WJM9_9POAL|nr:hypothetical protein BAE44_0001384 [Dichanthelium oligosanthes]